MSSKRTTSMAAGSGSKIQEKGRLMVRPRRLSCDHYPCDFVPVVCSKRPTPSRPRDLEITRCPKNDGVFEEQLVTAVTAAKPGSVERCSGGRYGSPCMGGSCGCRSGQARASTSSTMKRACPRHLSPNVFHGVQRLSFAAESGPGSDSGM